MAKNDDEKKIGKVKATKSTAGVEGTEAISEVGKVKATEGIGGVRGSGAVGKRRSTRIMTPDERDQLFKMIDEEAERLFEGSEISAHQKQVVKSAVKMAVDAGIVDEEKGKK